MGAIGRVTDRASFDALRRQGVRGRSGPVSLVWLPQARSDALGTARVAFAIDRRAGGAVTRNRIRRRLRAAVRAQAAEGDLPAGTYLLRGGRELAALPWPELRAHLATAVDRAADQRVRRT
jgi:ribonuclease P protein component